MKKQLLILAVLMLVGISTFAQSSKSPFEVLYFKANLSCCKAKSCNAAETEIQGIISKNFADGSVVFRTIKLAEEANRSLVDKYKAQSQTLVFVKTGKKGEVSIDASDIVKTFIQSQDKAALETALLAKVKELKKKK
jgi:hypothetical protein